MLIEAEALYKAISRYFVIFNLIDRNSFIANSFLNNLFIIEVNIIGLSFIKRVYNISIRVSAISEKNNKCRDLLIKTLFNYVTQPLYSNYSRR